MKIKIDTWTLLSMIVIYFILTNYTSPGSEGYTYWRVKNILIAVIGGFSAMRGFRSGYKKGKR